MTPDGERLTDLELHLALGTDASERLRREVERAREREVELEAELDKTRSCLGQHAIRASQLDSAISKLLDLCWKHWKGERPEGWFEVEATVERMLRQGRKP